MKSLGSFSWGSNTRASLSSDKCGTVNLTESDVYNGTGIEVYQTQKPVLLLSLKKLLLATGLID